MARERRLRVVLSLPEASHLASLLRAVGALEVSVATAPPLATLVARFSPLAPDYLEDRVEAWLGALEVADSATVETAVDDEPWQPGWRAVYRGAVVGRFHIRPPWLPPAGAGIDLIVDPRGAFGSGLHPSTAIMLGAMEAALEGAAGARLLDVGAGSGILSIAAARMGLDVTAIEIDPVARDACRRTVAANRVAVRVIDRALADLDERSPFVVANLHGDALRHLAAELRRVLEAGGTLVLGGLHPPDVPSIAPLYDLGRGHTLTSPDREWVVLTLGGLG